MSDDANARWRLSQVEATARRVGWRGRPDVWQWLGETVTRQERRIGEITQQRDEAHARLAATATELDSAEAAANDALAGAAAAHGELARLSAACVAVADAFDVYDADPDVGDESDLEELVKAARSLKLAVRQ